MITVDELIRTYGSSAFIKVDVEGYELQVLKGLRESLPCRGLEIFRAHHDIRAQRKAFVADLQQLISAKAECP